jgi:hypothetical protein
MRRPCLRAGLTVAFLQLAAAAAVWAQQPISPPLRPGFPVTLPGSGPVQVSQPAVGDLDNDGRKEIVVGTKGRQLWVLNADGSVRAGWPQTLPAEVVGSPAIGLIDGDAFPDIAVGFKGTTDPTGKGGIRAYRRDGSIIWERLTSTVEGVDGVYSSPAIGNVDGIGGNEVVVGSFDFNVYVIQSDGSDLPGWPKKLRDTIWSSPVLFDLDGDGKLEIIIGDDTHLEGPPYNTPNGGALYVFRPNGTLYPGFPKYIDQTMFSSPAVGDIDGDGRPEIVVGGGAFYSGNVGRKVYAWHCDGSPVAGWPVTVEAQVYASPALGRLEGPSGGLDVVISDANANVYAFRGNGSQIFKTKPKDFNGTSPNADNPIIADIDGDGVPEILVAVNGEIAILSSTGVQLTDDGSHDGRKTYNTDTSPSGAVVTDLDNDGRTDIVVASGTPFPSPVSGKVYVWTPGVLGPTPWPAFRQDPASRRGVVPGSPACPAQAPGFYTVTPCRIVDTRNPNGPFGGPALSAMTTRDFVMQGNCGISPAARAVSLNVTVTGSTSYGDLRLFPTGAPVVSASMVNWAPGRTRANNGIVGLGANGALTVWCVMPGGSTQVILDINGYFQ